MLCKSSIEQSNMDNPMSASQDSSRRTGEFACSIALTDAGTEARRDASGQAIMKSLDPHMEGSASIDQLSICAGPLSWSTPKGLPNPAG